MVYCTVNSSGGAITLVSTPPSPKPTTRSCTGPAPRVLAGISICPSSPAMRPTTRLPWTATMPIEPGDRTAMRSSGCAAARPWVASRRLDLAAVVVQPDGDDLPPLRLDRRRPDGHDPQFVITVGHFCRIQRERSARLALGHALAVDEQLERSRRAFAGERGGGLQRQDPAHDGPRLDPPADTCGMSAHGRQSGSPTINNW